jgi:phosphoribosylanthranilate isomerase
MRIKICGIRNDSDLKAALSASPDAVGFLVGQVHPSPDFILACTARRLAKSLPPFVQPWLVTHLSAPEEVLDLAEAAAIHNIQLHGESTPEEVSAIRDALPPCARLVRAVHPEPQDAFYQYAEFVPFIDAFLIDTLNPKTGQVGGTGLTGNWVRAARFVQESPLPVILAGGLTPANVARAIERVRPYAVDVNTGVKSSADRTESAPLCRAFVKAARLADLY